jgi:hypothetical protein
MSYALILALLLAGCGRALRSADWFESHTEERSRVLDRYNIHQPADAECATACQAARTQQRKRMNRFRKGFEDVR